LAPIRDNPRRTTPFPNIVLILADDLGWGDVSCQGQTNFSTPNIDRLAREGVRFTQAYAGATVCAPSRCSLMTGKHGGHSRVRSNIQVPLQPDDITIAEVLRSVNYRSGAFGKWALGWQGTTGTPRKQGFDEWYGYLEQNHAHAYYPAVLWRNDDFPMPVPGNDNGRKLGYAPDVLLRVANRFIQVNEDNPFFLYFASTLPHADNELGTNGMLELPSLGKFEDKPWPRPERGKAAMITRLDDAVGSILAELEQRKIDRQTVVIFTSDNGPHSEGGVTNAFFHSSGPFRGQKRDLYEGGIRVPFIVRWTDHISAGVTNDVPIAFWDVLPTLAELAGSRPLTGTDGISFAPSLFGREQKRRHDWLYWEFHEREEQKAVRFGDWKALLLHTNQPVELYNLALDPGETNNVAALRPEEMKRATELLSTIPEPFVAPTEEAPKPPK
jgi:arylsulfatase A-like enzyme